MQGQILNCYAPGDGSLHFTWMGKEYPAIAAKFYTGKLDKFEVNNWSTRAVIRYFLNYEEELRRADKNGVVHYN